MNKDRRYTCRDCDHFERLPPVLAYACIPGVAYGTCMLDEYDEIDVPEEKKPCEHFKKD